MNSFLIIVFTIITYFNFKLKKRYPFSFIFSLYWLINILISIFFFPDFIFSKLLLLFLLISSISIFIGERVGKINYRKNNNTLWFNLPLINKIFLVVFVLAILFPVVNLSNYGYNLFDLFSLKSLLKVNNKIAVLRYSGNIEKTFTKLVYSTYFEKRWFSWYII